MTNKLLPILFFSMLFLSSCLNNNEEPKIDCSTSDLSLSIESSMKAGCVTPGSVILSAIGGTGDYTYSADGTNFQSSANLENLAAGNFTFLVKDKDGCTASKSFTLEAETNAISLSLTATKSDCNVDNGGIIATASGGEGSLLYALDTKEFQESFNFSGVSLGTHKITVKDEAGCVVSKDIEVDANVSLSGDISPIISANCAISTCHGGPQSPNLSTSSAIIANASSIKSRTTAGTMPPAGRPDLSAAEIALIACWVDAGAKNN
jgi:hypothetical protein